MEAEAEILEPFELRFSDLLLLSSPRSSTSSAELARLGSISKAVMENLGPLGSGLLTITEVPDASELRRRLLPLARKLALLGNEDCRRVLKDHKLGTDVSLKNLGRSVSSFALQLNYSQQRRSGLSSSKPIDKDMKEHLSRNEFQASVDHEFEELGYLFEELGFCMMEIGARLAQLCDKAIGGRELEQTVLDSCTAKSRLIHYHSSLDNQILKESRRTRGSKKGPSAKHFSHLAGNTLLMEDEHLEVSKPGSRSCGASISHLWQQWHYDYGIFTILTTPMFIASKGDRDGLCISEEQVLDRPDEHSFLQILDHGKNKILMVQPSPESFIVQVGESADILSKAKLRATLHSVLRPLKPVNLSREAFVVFLQPAWDKTFSVSEYSVRSPENLKSSQEKPEGCKDENWSTYDEDSQSLSDQLHRMVPPLSSRLKDGMTFAEFSRQTTKQYYGGNGVQSIR